MDKTITPSRAILKPELLENAVHKFKIMNAKLKKSLNIAAAAIFIIGLAINIQMSLDDPFGNVSAVAMAQETCTGTGEESCDDSEDGGSGGTNYAYLEKLVSEPVYREVYTVSTGAQVWIKTALPVGISIEAEHGNKLVAEIKNCDSPSLARCDQNQMGMGTIYPYY